MNVYIRADASTQIGTGHVMRCLTLAHNLLQTGAHVSFLCSNIHGNMIEYIEAKGYQVYSLTPFQEDEFNWHDDAEQVVQIIRSIQVDVDWLIVDHYQIDILWEQRLRQHTKGIFVIDDIANRPHDCDILLDQNYYKNAFIRYESLLPEKTIRLLGPSYALLREEFRLNRQQHVVREGSIRRVLVFFGGSDPTNETTKALLALKQVADFDISIDVVVGSSNVRKDAIEELCSGWEQTTFHCQIENIADLIQSADLAIGAGGTATWERMFLGLPTLAIIIADNQEESMNNLVQDDYIWLLGRSTEVTIEMISNRIQTLLNKPNLLRQMSERLLELMPYDSEQSELPHVRMMLKREEAWFKNSNNHMPLDS